MNFGKAGADRFWRSIRRSIIYNDNFNRHLNVAVPERLQALHCVPFAVPRHNDNRNNWRGAGCGHGFTAFQTPAFRTAASPTPGSQSPPEQLRPAPAAFGAWLRRWVILRPSPAACTTLQSL